MPYICQIRKEDNKRCTVKPTKLLPTQTKRGYIRCCDLHYKQVLQSAILRRLYGLA